MSEGRETIIQNRITEDFKRQIVNCIRLSIEDDLPRYIREHQLVTFNGIGMQIGNYINGHLQRKLCSNDIEVHDFTRYGWHGRLIIDQTMRMVYTVMSNQRLKTLPRIHKETPHYSKVLAYILNSGYTASSKQITFSDICNDIVRYPYPDEIMRVNADKVICGHVPENGEFLYCVVAYESQNGQLSDCRIAFVDKDLDVIEDIALKEYIKPDYAQLTNAKPEPKADEIKSSDSLVAIKKKTVETAEVPDVSTIKEQQAEQNAVEPVTLREYRKQA